jgi:hypothetical protein
MVPRYKEIQRAKTFRNKFKLKKKKSNILMIWKILKNPQILNQRQHKNWSKGSHKRPNKIIIGI